MALYACYTVKRKKMYHEIIDTIRLINKQNILAYIVMSFIFFKLINYTIQASYYVLSHRSFQIKNLFILMLIMITAMIPGVNIIALYFFMGMFLFTIAVKFIYIIILIFDVDIAEKSFCQVVRIVYMNAKHGSFKII